MYRVSYPDTMQSSTFVSSILFSLLCILSYPVSAQEFCAQGEEASISPALQPPPLLSSTWLGMVKLLLAALTTYLSRLRREKHPDNKMPLGWLLVALPAARTSFSSQFIAIAIQRAEIAAAATQGGTTATSKQGRSAAKGTRICARLSSRISGSGHQELDHPVRLSASCQPDFLPHISRLSSCGLDQGCL